MWFGQRDISIDTSGDARNAEAWVVTLLVDAVVFGSTLWGALTLPLQDREQVVTAK
jgi:hypothetical protein